MPLAVAVLCYVIRTMRLMVRVVHGRLWLHQTPCVIHLITLSLPPHHTPTQVIPGLGIMTSTLCSFAVMSFVADIMNVMTL